MLLPLDFVNDLVQLLNVLVVFLHSLLVIGSRLLGCRALWVMTATSYVMRRLLGSLVLMIILILFLDDFVLLL